MTLLASASQILGLQVCTTVSGKEDDPSAGLMRVPSLKGNCTDWILTPNRAQKQEHPVLLVMRPVCRGPRCDLHNRSRGPRTQAWPPSRPPGSSSVNPPWITNKLYRYQHKNYKCDQLSRIKEITWTVHCNCSGGKKSFSLIVIKYSGLLISFWTFLIRLWKAKKIYLP